MDHPDHRLPVISDPGELEIPWRRLQTIIAGRSLIDTFELPIDNLDEAGKFLNAYGIQNSQDALKLLRTAHEYVESVLIKDMDLCLPDEILRLGLAEILVAASADDKSAESEWSCLLLKVCHALAHAKWTRDEDAYEAALTKVKTRLQSFVVEARDGIWIGDENCRIPLIDYRLKNGKEFFRIVTKLLLKQGNLSAAIYDHIGVRFVTKDIFSAILLIKFLRSRHVFV